MKAWMIVGSGLLVLASAACENLPIEPDGGSDDGDTVTVATVEIVTAESMLTEGEASTFEAVARDSAGAEVSSAEITWTSRDAAVAGVNAATGAVEAVVAGSTYIVAMSGEAADSVLLTVQSAMPSVTFGKMAVRVEGDTAATYILDQSFAAFGDVPGRDSLDMVFLDGEDSTSVGEFFFSAPESGYAAGSYALETWEVDELAALRLEKVVAGFLVYTNSEEESGILYLSTGGQVVVDSVTAPASPDEPGAVFGTASMTTAAHDWAWTEADGESITPTGGTATITVAFAAPYWHEPTDYVTTAVTSGPLAGAATDAWGSVGGQDAMTIGLGADIGEDGSEGLYILDIHLANIAVGTIALDSVGPDVWGAAADNFATGYAEIPDSTSTRIPSDLFGSGGTVEILEHEAAGYIEGTASVPVLFYAYDETTNRHEPTGESATLESYFILPLYESAGTASFSANRAARVQAESAVSRPERRFEPPFGRRR